MDNQTLCNGHDKRVPPTNGPDKRVPPGSEGHACRARGNKMDHPTLRIGRDERVPPSGPDKQVPPNDT